MNPLILFGIAVCLAHSAMFSGLNLALFGVSRLRLRVEAQRGDRAAATVLEMRADSHFLLTTILWGNVGINVLLTLLSESVLTGVGAFVFSTFVITLVGEIAPQAYFSRHALRMAALLAPVLRFYQLVLYVVAKPSARLLDLWLGRQGIQYFRERDLMSVIRLHAEGESDVDSLEGIGAVNFLALDDLAVGDIGEPVDPESVIRAPLRNGRVQTPTFEPTPTDPFVRQVAASGRKWVIITDESEDPHYVLDADEFLRGVLFRQVSSPLAHCHRPIVVTDPRAPLGSVWSRFEVRPEHREDHVIDQDVILVWGTVRRVITGADLFGRLLKGIARHPAAPGTV
jgi:hypothetical protein